MPILESQIDRNSDEFKQNRERMRAAIAEFREAEASVQAASEKSRERFAKRRQLMPRERIALLLDRGAPFLELMPLAGYRMHDDKDGSSAGGGSVAGIGYVEGVRCVVTASNSAIKGGTVAPSGQRKGQRVQQIVMENKLPVVNLVESGGANLLYQAEIFVPGGRGFANQARMSARGIPQVTVVHGSSTAGGAYLPGLSDYVIMVRNQAKVFLAGPPLLKAATGEIATDEDLGGAEMHATISGVAEWMAENDADGIRMARDVIATWHWNDRLPPRAGRPFKEPLYDVEELCGVVPPSHKDPYDAREVIARLVDGSEFHEFKKLYGDHPRLRLCAPSTACRWPSSPTTASSSPKAHRRRRTSSSSADQRRIRSSSCRTSPASWSARDTKRGGIAKDGAKMVTAVATATVPKIHRRHRRQLRAGNYGMCGRAYSTPLPLHAWPNARISVMGGEQAAGRPRHRQARAASSAKAARSADEQIDSFKQPIRDLYEAEGNPYYSTARLWDDGIIDPVGEERPVPGP
jgi:geranyl-CoA carboxylase beta subunit